MSRSGAMGSSSGAAWLTKTDAAGTYEHLGRESLAFYLDVTGMADGALSGVAAQIGGNVQTSGQQPTVIASGRATGPATGTTYFSPATLLSRAPDLLGCEVAFAGGTSQTMTMIASSDASIQVANAVHFNFGPTGFTVTVRKDAGAFDAILAGSWRKAVPTDGTTLRRFQMSIRNNTVAILGPNGEVFSIDDVRVGQLNGTLPIWEPNKSGSDQAFLAVAWAGVRAASGQISPYLGPQDALAAGFSVDQSGRLVGNRGTAFEVAIGLDTATGLPAIEFGARFPYAGALTSSAAISATSIVTDKYIPSGSTVQIESGNNTETVTASANSTGTGPYTTTVSALTKAHAVDAAVSVTTPAAYRQKIYLQSGGLFTPGSVVGANFYFTGQTSRLTESSSGVWDTGSSVGTGKGCLRLARLATGSRPSATTVGAGAQMYDTTLSKPIWSDGTTWRDAAGTAV